MNKFFLDTTIIISSLVPDRSEHIACVSILLQNNIPLLTNEYVIKETRRILEYVYSFDQGDINQFIEFLSTKMEIVKTPSKEEFSNIKSNDKSDRPIIFSAKKHNCILITDDIPTKMDALNYVMTFHSNEIIDVFEIKLAKRNVKLEKVKDGKGRDRYRVEILGFDYYDTKTGELKSGGTEKIPLWMLDTDYDGRSLFPQQVFFSMAVTRNEALHAIDLASRVRHVVRKALTEEGMTIEEDT